MNPKYIIITTIFLLLICSGTASAWIPDYYHRMAITVENLEASVLTDHQFNFTNDTNILVAMGHMQASGADCRITDSSDNLIPFWNETPFNATGTKIWAKNATLEVGSNMFYMYYGNAGATSSVDGKGTFSFFDGFEPISGWNKSASNPVLQKYTGAGDRFDDHYVYDAQIIENGTNDYIMYYTGIAGESNGPQRDNIGLATSPDLINWTRYNGSEHNQSIIHSGSSGDFDYNRAWGPGTVIRENATSWKMWYIGDSTWHTSQPDHTMRMGYATSTDGYNWTKYIGSEHGNAIFEDFDGESAYPGGCDGPAIIKESDTDYKMWYGIYTHNRIKYATSTDGINWNIQNAGNAVITGEYSSPGTAVKVGDTYYLYTWSPFAGGSYRDIKVHSSTDCVNWTNHGTQLTVSPGGWESLHAYHPGVVEIAPGNWSMFYLGSDGSTGGIGFATLNQIDPVVDTSNIINWITQLSTEISSEQAKSGDYSMKLNDSTTPSGTGKLNTTFSFQEGVLDYDFYRTPSDALVVTTLLDDSTAVFGDLICTCGLIESIYYRDTAGWLNYSNGGATATGNAWETHSLKFNESTSVLKSTVGGTYLGFGDKWNAGTIDTFAIDSGSGGAVGLMGYLDNIRVRKYAVTEPTSQLGAEEDAPAGGNNITIPANAYGFLRKDVTAAQTFSTITTGFVHKICFSWFNNSGERWESYWSGDAYNSDLSIPKHDAYFVLMDGTGEDVSCGVRAAGNVAIPVGWYATYLGESTAKNLTQIKTDIQVDGNVTNLYTWDHNAGGTGAWVSVDVTPSHSVLPNQGILINNMGAPYNWDGTVS